MPELSPSPRVWVAYSGGLDSHVLLHAMAGLRQHQAFELQAIYVNHGLSPHAADWGRHCQKVCAELAIPLHCIEVDARSKDGESPEAAARQARYQAIQDQLKAGDYLCTAHHQDDQAETLMLQLLRGAGPKGLAAMPKSSPLGDAIQWRPMLGFSRQAIQAYAEAHGLSWIEDESNTDTGLARNYLRHEVMPRLRARWPSMAGTLSRSANNCAEAAELMAQQAAADWQQVRAETDDQLVIESLLTLDHARQKNLLRHWVQHSGLPLPSAKKLQHILSDVVPAAIDARPCVHWPGAEVRRFENRLYLMPRLWQPKSETVVEWPDLEQGVSLPNGQSLAVEAGQGDLALDAEIVRGQVITLRFRSGGERIQPKGHDFHVDLKKLFQGLRVPPWQRERVPLLYIGDQLALVVGHCVDQNFAATDGKGLLVSTIVAIDN